MASPSALPPPPPASSVRRRAVEWLVTRARLPAVHAADAEVGVFNWAVGQAAARRVPRDWHNARFVALYMAKLRSALANLHPGSYVGNAGLAARIASGEVLPHDVATAEPADVFPERWAAVLERREASRRHAQRRPVAMTTQFTCSRCKRNECTYYEQQTRSADEPASIFVRCIGCEHRWRVG